MEFLNNYAPVLGLIGAFMAYVITQVRTAATSPPEQKKKIVKFWQTLISRSLLTLAWLYNAGWIVMFLSADGVASRAHILTTMIAFWMVVRIPGSAMEDYFRSRQQQRSQDQFDRLVQVLTDAHRPRS